VGLWVGFIDEKSGLTVITEDEFWETFRAAHLAGNTSPALDVMATALNKEFPGEPMATQVDAFAAKVRKQIEARVGEIKADLTAYIEQDTDLLNDGVPVSIALLDMALDRFIDLHGEQDAHQFIDSALAKAVQRSKARRVS
jgi:hypothetical protein